MTIGKTADGGMTITLTPDEAKQFDHPNRKRISKTTGSANGEFRIDVKMTRTAPPETPKNKTTPWRPTQAPAVSQSRT